jgi:hypothetical protein
VNNEPVPLFFNGMTKDMKKFGNDEPKAGRDNKGDEQAQVVGCEIG